MYPTAHGERNYPVDNYHYPELLNITDTIFCYAIPYMEMKLETELVNMSDKTNNWLNGFELTFARTFNRYNGASKEKDIKNRQYGYTISTLSKKVKL
jgi:hypothetical protein